MPNVALTFINKADGTPVGGLSVFWFDAPIENCPKDWITLDLISDINHYLLDARGLEGVTFGPTTQIQLTLDTSQVDIITDQPKKG